MSLRCEVPGLAPAQPTVPSALRSAGGRAGHRKRPVPRVRKFDGSVTIRAPLVCTLRNAFVAMVRVGVAEGAAVRDVMCIGDLPFTSPTHRANPYRPCRSPKSAFVAPGPASNGQGSFRPRASGSRPRVTRRSTTMSDTRARTDATSADATIERRAADCFKHRAGGFHHPAAPTLPERTAPKAPQDAAPRSRSHHAANVGMPSSRSASSSACSSSTARICLSRSQVVGSCSRR